MIILIVKIAENIFYVGIDDKQTRFFEGIWPIPNGISYNSYLIIDDKIALIEGGVRATFSREFLDDLSSIVDIEKIDYIIVNHMEPDHTGTLPILYRLAPNSKIIVSNMGKRLLKSFYDIEDEERVVVVKDGDKISLGQKELVFYTIPGVHWPDSMVTYEPSEKILFSSDAFGTYGSLNGRIFDDEIDIDFFLTEGKRYFTNIVGKFCAPTQVALKKLSGLKIKIVAPAHGPVWRKNPKKIIELYDKLSKYESKEKVLIMYGSMYGFNKQAAEYLAKKLVGKGVDVKLMDVTNWHPSYILAEAWDSKIVVIGVPTYDGGAFPLIYTAATYLQKKLLKNKYYAIFGTFGWSGKGYKEIREILDRIEWKLVEPIVEINGKLRKENKELLDRLAEEIASKV